MSNPTTQPDLFDGRAAVLDLFHPVVREWFGQAFSEPTRVQQDAWPAIASGRNSLVLAPTGSGKTLAAFLVAIDRIMFPDAGVVSGEPTGQSEQRAERVAPPCGRATIQRGATVPESESLPLVARILAERRTFSPLAPQGVRLLYISPLKALGVDVERNLRAPLAGVRAVAERMGVEYHLPSVGVRSGDTPASERTRLLREPPEILITTPESLYLMLTSRAREMLRPVETVIVDEIHSMVGTKRGVHLFLSLERLQDLRESSAAPFQRVGLSATVRPIEEVARLLGGAEWSGEVEPALQARPVEIIQAGRKRQLDLRIEVPVEDMGQLASAQVDTGPAAGGPVIPSIWPRIHPRLVQLIREHRSTMIFVNSRRLAERLAAAINELAEEEIALAHHGSIAKATRLQIEDRLKRGQLPAIVATSSLELGIDMGAVDLVIQIEAPPSIASGIQRIGRSGHQVGACSKGIVFPKYRGDLLACGAAAERMMDGEVEPTSYPRNPLDVLAQQLVAMVALESVSADQLYATVRRAAPFHELPRSSFDGVLDLLAGRYPSDEFSELRPRINWDRVTGTVAPRRGSQRLAILNGGTIPDRGLYGVYLVGAEDNRSRVGELDEEMVFETRPGEIFLLGASSWRVVEITKDRVLVSPAPGEPGKMPFWKGEGPGRPLEFGRAIGRLTRQLLRLPEKEAQAQLCENHGLDERAARNLLQYLRDQSDSTGEPPSDTTIVVESFLDEVGDWRIAVLSPFGARIHAPWATAVAARLRAEGLGEIDMMWSDDGILFRLPEASQLPSADLLVPDPDEVEPIVVRELGSTALFAARFRENAARALLLPRRQPGRRSPLWLQRRRAADLLSVAARFPDFPILLETYRECLRDVFDIKGLRQILQDVRRQSIRVVQVETQTASPFAASLLFNYTAHFLYEGDTPLAERRAQTLALDHAQLRELLGDAELRELLCAEAVDQVVRQLQRLEEQFRARDEDDVHDLLRQIGDLTEEEIADRTAPEAVATGELRRWLQNLTARRRVVQIRIAGATRYAAAEDASRFRDALGIMPPAGLPDAFLQNVDDPLGDLVSRYARTHGPFHIEELAQRFDLGIAPVRTAIDKLVAAGRILEGEFLPGGRGREWCDANVLRLLKRRSLARLRKQVEPVEPEMLARFLPQWQAITNPRRGLDGLLDAIQQLQGLPLPASVLEQEILPCRVVGYRPADLDTLCTAGEVVWRGFESLGSDDGRVALYLTDQLLNLAPPPMTVDVELADAVSQELARSGAVFFEDLARSIGGFRNDVLTALWQLVWAGHVTNDTLAPLRSLRSRRRTQRSSVRHRSARGFRSRRSSQQPGSEGRWSLLERPSTSRPSPTQQQLALVQQLVERYGVLTREMIANEAVRGGFAAIYPTLKAMEEAGKVRRGYFVAGLGAAQFAAPGAEDRLRDSTGLEQTAPVILAATDPANAFGGALPWPAIPDVAARPQRAAGARVILDRGQLLGYLSRTGQHLMTFLSDDPDESDASAAMLAQALATAAQTEPVLLARIDGHAAQQSPFAAVLQRAGFVTTSKGLLCRGRY